MDAEKLVRRKWRLLTATMDERARRLWAGAEADAMGWGGIAAVARATGLAISTVTLGRTEVRGGACTKDVVKVRRKGGGRRRHEAVHPELMMALEKLGAPATPIALVALVALVASAVLAVVDGTIRDVFASDESKVVEL